jgi:hypothetical protein
MIRRLLDFSAYEIGVYETVLIFLGAASIAAAFLWPRLAGPWFTRLEAVLARTSGNAGACVLLIVGIAVLGRLALWPLIGTPEPVTADETSLLLQASTYAHGRLSNHPHDMPATLEAYYTLLSPSYASMYPVFRTLPMAASAWLRLGYWPGVLATVAALSVAVFYLVRLYLPARYAVVAALLTILRYGLFSIWVNSYEGAALTALGGVLALTGYRLMGTRITVGAAAALGSGLLLMMTTRPYEGMVFALPLVFAVAWRFFRARMAEPRRVVWAAGIICGLVLGGFAATAAENDAVTGKWTTFPYQLYRQQSAQSSEFMILGSPEAAPAKYDQTRRFFRWESKSYRRSRSLRGVLSNEFERIRNDLNFYVGSALLIPFVIGLWQMRRERVLLASGVCLAAGLSIETWSHAHYAAPSFGLFVLATIFGLETLRGWAPRGRPVGLTISRLLIVALVLATAYPLYELASGATGAPPPMSVQSACCWLRTKSIHVAVARYLDRIGSRRNLVLVDTGPAAPLDSVVYNDADPDGARTLWAHDDSELNPQTIGRFPGRQIWRLGWSSDGSPCLSANEPRHCLDFGEAEGMPARSNR